MGVGLVAILSALCATALGIMIAAIARTENQIAGLACWCCGVWACWAGALPRCPGLEAASLGPLPKIVPQYWANRAFDDLLIRGLGLQDIALELACCCGFTIFFFAIGLWRFDFE